ncbi:glycosyltransferase [Mucilaginibacter sp. McL0603]
MDQTHPNCEIIIVDDCSKYGTVDILKQYANELNCTSTAKI